MCVVVIHGSAATDPALLLPAIGPLALNLTVSPSSVGRGARVSMRVVSQLSETDSRRVTRAVLTAEKPSPPESAVCHTVVTDACGLLRTASHGTAFWTPGLAFYLNPGGLAGWGGMRMAGVRIPRRALRSSRTEKVAVVPTASRWLLLASGIPALARPISPRQSALRQPGSTCTAPSGTRPPGRKHAQEAGPTRTLSTAHNRARGARKRCPDVPDGVASFRPCGMGGHATRSGEPRLTRRIRPRRRRPGDPGETLPCWSRGSV